MNAVPLDTPLGCRINVRGNGGKTTLARAISRKRDMPFIELDAIHWLPGFMERAPDDFRRETAQAMLEAGSCWVVDGNYRVKLADLVTSEADMIIYLNFPWRVKFWRVLKRSFMRAWTKEKLFGDNVEKWRIFFSRESLWWEYIAQRHRFTQQSGPRLPHVPPDVPIVLIESAKDLNEFYRLHGLERWEFADSRALRS
jgi:adenylate kinase family enzyme